MPKLAIPKGTKPRNLLALAGLTYPGPLPSDLIYPAPGAQVSPRTALRYAMRATGCTKDQVASATLSDLKAFWSGDDLRAAWGLDAWKKADTDTDLDDDQEDAPAPVVAPVVAPVGGGLDALLGGIVAAQVAAQVQAAMDARPALDREAIAAIARDAAQVVRIELVKPDAPPVVVEGLHHEAFPSLLAFLAAGQHVYLYGPAGGGKSSAAKAAAKALGLAFASTGKIESRYDLIGFRDAHGRTIRTPFREVWQNGGLFLLDELDRSDPSAVVALNNALATGDMDFPDATVAKHPTTLIVGGGNTRLAGGDRNYTAAISQDASVQDRFAFLPWSYDERLERELAGQDQVEWTLFVQRVRRASKRLGVDLLVTPRASIDGARMLRAGISRDLVEQARLWKGLDDASVDKIRQEAN